MLDGAGTFSAKTGGTGGTFVTEFSGGQAAIAVGDGPHGPLLGRLDSAGTFYAKAGSLSSAWIDEFNPGQKLIAVEDGSDGPVLGRVEGTGALYVKRGGLSTAWQLAYSPSATTPNPAPVPPTQVTQTTPVPKSPSAIRRIRLTSGLPAHGRVAVRCMGPRCPHIRATAAGHKAVARMLARLAGRRLRAGDRPLITVTAPRHRPEQVELRIRRGRTPVGRVLRS
jgi:hypothetical protein